MIGYVSVGVLPEEDVGSVKLRSEEQRIFKVHVVVPERIFLDVGLFAFETWCRETGGDCCS